ncbi:hypothetical protein [Dactylosporangium matsuzakiense]|uniref:Uncharacterized protein n=1 Tax=Dactylosporangium matsuzakiense TaxID=53360 RepID=A0A9W6KIW2_9ACTN|nr:hypothetical protein [Dactylosporangium matsuzakiense]UWZ45633.1 hypothetical protein Dmats_03685 [Dactylosporangium matsuzakiense]GLL00354.1 hypothetical protein GCM10017581_020940 [Dactylosporangium matsuzakiense]
MDVLVEEAAKKAAVAWVAVDGRPAALVWCAWLGGALLVVTGEGEQAVPALAEATTAEVSLRGDHGGRIVTFPAEVTRIAPGDEAWTELVPQLAAKRLNAAGGAEELTRVWSERCVVSRLTPAGASAGLPDDAQAAPPRPTAATRLPRRPFRLHKVRGATKHR